MLYAEEAVKEPRFRGVCVFLAVRLWFVGNAELQVTNDQNWPTLCPRHVSRQQPLCRFMLLGSPFVR